MTSYPGSIPFGSASSGYSFRDAVASCTVANELFSVQIAEPSILVAGSTDEDNDERASQIKEQRSFHDQEETNAGFFSQHDWDPVGGEDQSPAGGGASSEESVTTPRASIPVPRRTTERTPLIRKKISFNRRPPLPSQPKHQSSDSLVIPSDPWAHRRPSVASYKPPTSIRGGSTYGQSLFNSIAILLGIGMLSEPLAFSYAGWGLGTVLIFGYGLLTSIILEDPRLRSYSDIGRKAFGPKSTLVISIMFCLELFAVSVILVTLYADSLHSIFPTFIPTVYLPLSVLSYTSILGITSTILIVSVILVDGFSKKTAPGSLWEPAPTSIGIDNPTTLALSFGLFMAGFSGHAVIPSLARDMVDPTQFDHMINWAFIVATGLYALVGAVGYRMFGNNVSDEVSPGYSKQPLI
ncbi:amino acid transporter [Flagelloscypha sp. PMI_526]|nr:amino acid transporter [Flagelloscypha sp. PMI_526]